ncbi:MAG: LytTR family DNA-binding domain-containing protein, partial [Bacteroidota bacterium]
CNNGVDAVKDINTFKPDLVFLDIQMPGLTGFEVLGKLEEMPHIIFSTAYDQYAFEAFEVHAVDYLLKPVKQERFDEAIRKLMNYSADDYLSQLQHLVHSINEQDTHLNNILVSVRNKLINVPVDDIIQIKADGNYAQLITKEAAYLSSYGISRLAEKMNPQQFIRVHRSAIINIRYVKEVYSYPSSFEIVMKNGDLVKVSRSYLDNIKKMIV